MTGVTQDIADRRVSRRNGEGASAPDAPQHGDADLAMPTTQAPLTAANLCIEAAQLVSGSRATTHGDKRANFTAIADLWNGYWRIKCRTADERIVTPFTALDVGNMMELLKIARRLNGTFNADDYIDAAGYAGCTGEIAAHEQEKTTNSARTPTDP